MNASSRILIATLILGAGSAWAATPDHSGFSTGECLECHQGYDQPFMSPGPQDKSPYHQGYDCTQCHDTQDRLTPNLYYIPETIATPSSGDKSVVFTARSGANSFADGDGTYDGICEVCHTTTNYHRNDATGNHTHEAGNTCVDCHTHGDGFATNCFSCHNVAVGTGGNRRQIVENAGDGNGDFVLTTHHVTNGTTTEVVTSADCLVCHDNLNHMTYSDGVSVLLKDPAGGAPIEFDGTAASIEAFCLACHDGTHLSPFSDGNPAPDLSGWVGSNHGSPAASCFDCHQNGHGSGNFRLVDEQIDTPNSGAKTVVFSGRTGTNSFADGDGTYDGVCEVCHTATAFHRNTSAGSHGHYATEDCATCHDHGNSFEADGSDCISCHKDPQGPGDYRRQIVENSGDGNGDFVLSSHHVTNGTTTEVVTNADCVVCHDQANHMSYSDGVSVLLEDALGGASHVYDGTPASLETFCLSCHDGAHSSPFSDGNAAPDISTWDGNVHGASGKTCAECHPNGHGTGNLALIGDAIVTPNSGTRTVNFDAWTGANSFADGNATYDGVCEVCHTTTNFHRNDASGDHTHEAAADCRSCHGHNAGYIVDTTDCIGCHDEAQGPGDYRRQIVENAGDGGGDFVLASHHVTNGTQAEVVTNADCIVCHDNANHTDYGDGVSVYLVDPAGGASILYDGTAASLDAFCLACHDGTHSSPFSDGNAAPDKSGWNGGVHGPSGKSCAECHPNGHGTGNLDLVGDTISTPNSGDWGVVFSAYTGTNSFADGDASYDGVCEACHTTTDVHRNNASGGHLHNKTLDCRGCHTHDAGYISETSCVACHNTAVGSGGYRRQIVENAGDGNGDFVLTSHHVTNGTATEIVTDADCVVCHDQSNHMNFSDGVSVLLVDPASGPAITYDGTPGSLDAFCLACHDGTHSSPFSDGNAAPDMSAWNGAVHGPAGKSCAECHPNGHGSGNINLIGDTIATPNSGNWSVLFTGYTGTNSYADGDVTYDGVCEACHTTTSFHRNNASGTHAHQAGNDCRACHTHNEGYQADGTDCMGCHDAAVGSGGYRRQIVENAGDGNGDFVLASHHVTNGTTTEVVTNADCVVCHDQANHMSYSDGVSVYLVDPAGGSSILYDGTGSSLEAFCLACHDGTHLSPFSDGNPAPDKSAWVGNVHGPSGKTCADCHNNGHGTSNLVMFGDQIATPNSGTRTALLSAWTGTNSLADGDATYDGACEVCHTTTSFHRNTSAGNHSHQAGNDCRTCHDHDAGYFADGTDCMGCHNVAVGSGGYRRQIVENAGDGNGDFVLASHHVTDMTTTEVVTNADCIVCHDQANHMTYSDGVSVLLEDALGGASHLYDGTPASLESFCLSCHDGTHVSPFSDGFAAVNMSSWDGNVHGPSGKTCAECHPNGHGTSNIDMIGGTIATPNSGNWTVLFTGYTGTNSYADGDATYDGVCEACHTTTSFHRNTSAGNHSHQAGNDCRGCHTHNTGYQADGTDCMGCHNVAVGSGGYRRQIVENASDGNGDFVLTSHHVTNGTTTEVVTNADCVVCHDQANHMSYGDGVSVYLVDPGGGSSILYDGTDASLEAFCLACHDGTHSSPFSDGTAAPDKSGWTSSGHGTGRTCAECHGNGHGTDNLAMVSPVVTTPSSGDRTVVLSSWTGTNSMADGNATYDGVCEVCHTATTFHRNNATGNHTHEAATDCRSCHDHDASYAGDGTDCASCHNKPQGTGGYRRQIVENAGDNGGDFVLTSHHVTNGTQTEVVTNADCVVCHDQANHMSYSDGVSVYLEDPAGGASILYDGSGSSLEAFCLACHDGTHSSPFSDGNPAADMSTWDGNVHGPSGKTCAECHPNGHGSSNIDLIGDTIATPNSGNWSVVFNGYTGSKSFADGDGTYDGVCEACHTTTTFHRNTSAGNHTHEAANDCRGCHTHNEGYIADSTDCMGCHNTAVGSGGYRRQIVEDNNDGLGDFETLSHHVNSGPNEVVTNADCVVCHDQANHMSYSDGVSVYLVDPGGGSSMVYDGTPSSLDTFCQNCHDGTHTSPFSDGVAAPDVSSWNGTVHGPSGKSCAECHNNGHGTENLKLIGEQIVTPNSGTKTVVFTSLTGTNSYADGDGNYDGVCEVCHTNLDRHNNNAAGDHTHEAGNDCAICHDHNDGYSGAGAESAGGVACGGCHSAIYNPMNSSTSSYHHQIDSDSADYAVGNKTCLICHVDHDIFRPDLNTGVGTRAANLRVDTSTAVSQGNSGVLLDSDYQSGGAGGVCLSCHVSAQTKGYTQPDGSTQTPALSKADYDAATSAHNYDASSTYGDASTFKANCSKCHNDDITKSYQTGNGFGTHDSPYRTIVDPAGVSGPSDPLEEDFCLRCHSTTGNPNSGSNLDYYGGQAMSSTSLRVGDAMNQTYAHPTATVSGVHDVIETGPADFGAGNRHAECTDCHDVHATIASNPLKGVWGVTPTSWPARPTPSDNGNVFAAPSGYNVVSSGAEEWQICLKCHSNYVTLPGGSPNIAEEINPNYESMHGIAAPGNNGFANSATMHEPWGTTSRNACSDCHRSGNSSDPGGPHGSNLEHLLVATATSNNSVGTPLCYNCHLESIYWGSGGSVGSGFSDHPSTQGQHKLAPGCFSCHMWSFSTTSGLGVNTTNNYQTSGRIHVHGMNKRWIYNEQDGTDMRGDRNETTTPYADAFVDGYLEYMDTAQDKCWTGTCKEHSNKAYGAGKSLEEIPAVISRAKVYPLPSSGDVNIVLEKEIVDNQGNKSMALVEVEASVYDVSGRKIRDLRTSHQGAGDVLFQWDGRDNRGARVVSGLYFCRLKTSEFSQIVKIVIVR